MALSKTAKQRLLTLVRYMEALPKKANGHFNMDAHWAEHRGPHALSGTVTKRTLMDCGTSACAMGWAGAIPSFRKAGLRLEWVDVGWNQFRAHFDADKAREFFDLTEHRFWKLFNNDNPERDSTPKKWAKRARLLIRQWST